MVFWTSLFSFLDYLIIFMSLFQFTLFFKKKPSLFISYENMVSQSIPILKIFKIKYWKLASLSEYYQTRRPVTNYFYLILNLNLFFIFILNKIVGIISWTVKFKNGNSFFGKSVAINMWCRLVQNNIASTSCVPLVNEIKGFLV